MLPRCLRSEARPTARQRRAVGLALLLVALPAALHLAGCSGTRAVDPATGAASTTIPAEQVPAVVARLNQMVMTRLIAAADRLDQIEPTGETRRTTLRFRLRMQDLLRQIQGLDNALEQLIELWVLVSGVERTQAERFADRGERFVPVHELLVSLRDEVTGVARQVLPAADFAAIDARVAKAAEGFAVVSDMNAASAAGSVNLSEITKPLTGLLSIPLSPFDAFRGVDRSSAALESMAKTGARAVTISERLPEQVRWESELLVLQLLDTEQVRGALADSHRLTDTAAQLAATAAQLPAQVRDEVQRIVTTAAPEHERLNTTLVATKQALAQLDTTAAALGALAARLESLMSTAHRLYPPAPAPEGAPQTAPAPQTPAPPPGPPFDIRDYTAALAAAERTTVALTDLVAHGEALVPQANATITRVTWRVVLVLVVAAVLAAALIVLVKQLPRRR